MFYGLQIMVPVTRDCVQDSVLYRAGSVVANDDLQPVPGLRPETLAKWISLGWTTAPADCVEVVAADDKATIEVVGDAPQKHLDAITRRLEKCGISGVKIVRPDEPETKTGNGPR